MPVTIPCRSDLTHYDMHLVLDNTNYVLEFQWNFRESSWYMSVLTETGDYIQSNIKIVVEFSLGARTVDNRWPPGRFVALDTASTLTNPGQTDLGDRVQLIYFSEAEVIAAGLG